MILDEFGRPVAQSSGFHSGLNTPQWVQDTCMKLLRSDVASHKRLSDDMKVADLYESAGVDRASGLIVGNTVTVRTPSRMRGVKS